MNEYDQNTLCICTKLLRTTILFLKFSPLAKCVGKCLREEDHESEVRLCRTKQQTFSETCTSNCLPSASFPGRDRLSS